MAKLKKKVVLEPAGKDLKEFQGKYAGPWVELLNSSMFQAGLQFLRNRKLDTVANLTEDQIEKNGREYISDLKGFLQHENELLRLHEMTEFTLPFDDSDQQYISPEQEVELGKQLTKFQEENRKKRYVA